MHKRILLKLSGEALSTGNRDDGCLDFQMVERTAAQIKTVVEMGTGVGLVIGGGNIFRGRASGKMDRNRADQMGMLSTAINSIAMEDALISLGVPACILSAAVMPRFAETYTYRRVQSLWNAAQNGMRPVLLFSCGTGHPFFSTDTAAALRAAEIDADVLLLAKKVDAVYSADPAKSKDAVRYERLSYEKVITDNLKATDLTAITLCKENNIPIRAFGLQEENSIVRAARGENIGTLICAGE